MTAGDSVDGQTLTWEDLLTSVASDLGGDVQSLADLPFADGDERNLIALSLREAANIDSCEHNITDPNLGGGDREEIAAALAGELAAESDEPFGGLSPTAPEAVAESATPTVPALSLIHI